MSIEAILKLKAAGKPVVFLLYDSEDIQDEHEQRIFRSTLVVEVMNALRLNGFCQIYAAKLLVGTAHEVRVRTETFELLELLKEQIHLLKFNFETVHFETLETSSSGSVSIRMDIHYTS